MLEKVLLVTVTVLSLKRPPPVMLPELPEKVLLATVSPESLKMPPPLDALLSMKELLPTVIWLALKMAPPWLIDVLLEKVLPVMTTVPPLPSIPLPLLPELAVKV